MIPNFLTQRKRKEYYDGNGEKSRDNRDVDGRSVFLGLLRGKPVESGTNRYIGKPDGAD
jgi:hypothetical protein